MDHLATLITDVSNAYKNNESSAARVRIDNFAQYVHCIDIRLFVTSLHLVFLFRRLSGSILCLPKLHGSRYFRISRMQNLSKTVSSILMRP